MSTISSISSHSSSSSVTQSNNTSRIIPDFQVITSSALSTSSSCFANPFSPPVSSALSSVVQSQSSSSTVPLLIQPQSTPESALTSVSQIPKIVQSKLEPTTFPNVLNVLFLSYLDLDSLDQCSKIQGWEKCTNVLWNSFDLRTLFPKLRFFDERGWKTYADLSALELNVSDARPLNKRTLIPELSRLISSTPIEQDSGFTLLTIPKGLTLDKLIRLAVNPKQGHITNFGSVWYREEIGAIPVDHTYRMVISNNVLTGSRGKSATSHDALVKEIGCQMSSVLEATTLMVTTHMCSGKRLCNDSPMTYTRCSDQISDQINGGHLIVGGFGPDGLNVEDVNFCFLGFDNIGVACALREF